MRKLLLSVTVLAVLFTSCKDKLEKKDKTLSEMQNEDENPNNYVPVLSTASESPVYKKINDTVDMHLNIYYPEKHNHKRQRHTRKTRTSQTLSAEYDASRDEVMEAAKGKQVKRITFS